MTCPCASGCLYTKEGKRRGHNFPRDEPLTYIDNTRILLDLIRPRNRIVPTDNMTLRIRVKIVFTPALYLAWFSLQKYHTPSSSKCSSVYENAWFYLIHPKRKRSKVIFRQNREIWYCVQRVFLYIFVVDKIHLPESLINTSLKGLFFIFEAFSLTILNHSQNQKWSKCSDQ